jgi:transposase
MSKSEVKKIRDRFLKKPREIDDKMIVEAVLYVMRTGIQWRKMPSEFPNWKNSLYSD